MTCTHPDHECYPYYGGAPGRDFVGPVRALEVTDPRTGERRTLPATPLAFVQRSTTAPRETWPKNFAEDPDAPGLGSWHCPGCMEGSKG